MGPGVAPLLWPQIQDRRTVLFEIPFRDFKSQGPDLNWSIAALQAAAWPLRHRGIRVANNIISTGINTLFSEIVNPSA